MSSTLENKISKGSLSLSRNFSWTLLGNIIYALCQWGILMALAKLGDARMVGQFALALAVTAPVFMFLNLQLRAVLATDANKNMPFSQYIGLRICTTFLALIVLGGFIIISGYDVQTQLIIFLIALSKAAESISDIIYGLLQNNEKMDFISISLIVRGVASLLVTSGMLYVTGDLTISLLTYMVSWLLILIVYDIPKSRIFSVLTPTLSLKSLLPLLRISLPMGFVMLLISLNTNIPRYFISGYEGTEQLGYFSALAYVMVAGTTVISALGQSASPRLAKYYSSGKLNSFYTLLMKIGMLFIILALSAISIVVFLGQPILSILYGSSYSEYSHIFTLITIGAGIGYLGSLIGYGLTAARIFGTQVYLFLFINMSLLLACYLLIPSLGLEGAAYSLIIGNIAQVIGSLFIFYFHLYKRGSTGNIGTVASKD
ncbi:lipopolysaccharide biosynthesis protein [Paenibacillus sp. FJAT-26967]|uniref:lipopolysaccharide biosynthesis protein n=1 Tax=Paenibacillus sp. FJAT-26967 TaxID=1729690 RepID=UPI000837BDC4|nr:oligosaccharide flippase family protein [Paenibacillus sp. FJAT-26967]